MYNGQEMRGGRVSLLSLISKSVISTIQIISHDPNNMQPMWLGAVGNAVGGGENAISLGLLSSGLA